MERARRLNDRVGGMNLEAKSLSAAVKQVMTCRINKNFNLFDLTCNCLRLQSEILVQWRLHASL